MPTELLPSGSAPPDFNLQKSHLRGSPSAITSAQKFRAKRSRNRRRKMSTCRQTRSAHLDSLGQFPSARTVIPKPSSAFSHQDGDSVYCDRQNQYFPRRRLFPRRAKLGKKSSTSGAPRRTWAMLLGAFSFSRGFHVRMLESLGSACKIRSGVVCFAVAECLSERKHAPANKAHAGKLSLESFHNKNGGALQYPSGILFDCANYSLGPPPARGKGCDRQDGFGVRPYLVKIELEPVRGPPSP